MSYPTHRPRRLRRTEALRRLVRETRLSVDDLVAPLFVCPGEGVRQPIESMPGRFRLSVDGIVAECRELHRLGVPGVILFGIPERKDAEGKSALDEDGVVPRALRAVRGEVPELSLWADVCLCEYTDHGHCGPLAAAPTEADVDNDATLPLLSRRPWPRPGGRGLVAPSDMMDGRVGAIRRRSTRRAERRPILSYAAKFASAFYGPFREAAGPPPVRRPPRLPDGPAQRRGGPARGGRSTEEGADMVMVKPALAYLDVVTA